MVRDSSVESEEGYGLHYRRFYFDPHNEVNFVYNCPVFTEYEAQTGSYAICTGNSFPKSKPAATWSRTLIAIQCRYGEHTKICIHSPRYEVCWLHGRATLCLCGKMARNWPVVHPPDDRWMIMEWGGGGGGKPLVFGGNPFSLLLCWPQIPQGVVVARILVCTSRALPWPLARCCVEVVCTSVPLFRVMDHRPESGLG